MNGEAESRERSRTPSPLSRSSSRSSIGQSPARTTLLKRNQSLSAKQVRFYRNGDKYFGGLKLAVSSERYKEFFALLVELSNKLDLKTGAVRFVFDAETGRQVTDVSQLNTNSSYVCSSSNSFKEIEGGYGQTQPKNWSTGGKRDRRELTNWDKSTPRMDSKREFIKPKLVTIVKNGKPPQKKVTMLLNKKTALDLNQVLDHLSSKGTLGKVDRLCCLDGREIKELRDLFDEDMIFIAFSSNERFPEEGFDVDVQSPKQSWNTSIRPSRSPYTPSLRTEHEYSWKDLPRARCLACALKALTAVNTPSPQSRQRPRPKSAPPRLSNRGQKARKPESRPSTSSSKRSLQPKPSKSPRISPVDYKDAPSSGPKSSSKKPSVRASYPKMSSPKSSTSVKKSLSFSPETKEEETDSTPKPKGIRGGGRRRKAQLALMKEEEFREDDPQHAYYVLIHEDMKSGKPTASVKPIMSGENDAVGGEKVTETAETETSVNREAVDNVGTDTSVVISGEAEVIKSVVHAVSEAQGPVENNMVNGVNDEHSRKSEVFENKKVVKLMTSVNGTVESPVADKEQSPATNNNTTESPANANEGKPMERDWSKPKPIRGRKKKPKADMNGNEQSKPEENHGITSEQDNLVNGAVKCQQQTFVVANGDSYRITPYRDLKRPSGVKRTSSLRTPRPRRNTLESNSSGGGNRGRSVSPSTRTNGQMSSTPRSKLNGSKKSINGGPYTSGEELYPAAVFQRENSDSAKRKKKTKNSKSVAKKVPRTKTLKPVNSDKFYSTVWLSDYESWDMKSETGDPSTGVSSRATTPYSSRPTTPFDSKGSSPLSSPPSSPFVARETYNDDDVSGNPSETDRPQDPIQKSKPVKLKRTLSLPESELSQIEASDLQQRFTTLQLEQENRELKQLTDDLQGALENLEKRVHSVSESDQNFDGKTSDGRTPPYSSDDVFADERTLPQRATSEPSSPSSISSNDTFVHSPKLSKPNSLDLSGSGARKRKHTEKLNSSAIKTRKSAKRKEESICCITS